MPPHMPLPKASSVTRILPQLCLRHARQRLKPFSSTPNRSADGQERTPTNLTGSVTPPETAPFKITRNPSGPSDQPLASSSSSLLAAEDQVPAPPKAAAKPNARSSAAITQILRRNLPKSPTEVNRRRAEATANSRHASNIENQITRYWHVGDIYAPHDLSPAEMRKARNARSDTSSPSGVRPLNSRRKGSKDVIDVLGINPITEYKNIAMMSEYVSKTGRISHSRETGLRAVNQRKMAKAIRRAIGVGLMPSVHRHPELYAERMSHRGQSTLGMPSDF